MDALNLGRYPIQRMIEFFADCGYSYVDTPWIVPSQDYLETVADAERGYEVKKGQWLVGSAEQGFLASWEDLEPDSFYMSFSPCFRPVDKGRSEIHFPYFYKLELHFFSPEDSLCEEAVIKMRDDALDFMNQLREGFEDDSDTAGWHPDLPKITYDHEIVVVETDQGTDIEIDGVELGSYGVRQRKGIYWAYGTGFALPRLDAIWE